MKHNRFSALNYSIIDLPDKGLYIYSNCLINVQEDTPHVCTIIGEEFIKSCYDEEKVFGLIMDNLEPENLLFVNSHYMAVFPYMRNSEFKCISEYMMKNGCQFEKGVVNLFNRAHKLALSEAQRQRRILEEKLAA